MNAFTLLELLISVSLIMILSAGIVPAFVSYLKSQNVRQAKMQVKNDLRLLQSNALTGSNSEELVGGVKPNYWGVRFQVNQTSYSYFISVDAGCPPASSATKGQSELLSGSSKVIGSDVCMFFSFGNADSPSQGTVTLSDSSGSKCASVTVNTNGLITSADITCP